MPYRIGMIGSNIVATILNIIIDTEYVIKDTAVGTSIRVAIKFEMQYDQSRVLLAPIQ